MFSSCESLKEWIGKKPFTVQLLSEWVQWRKSNGLPWVFSVDLNCPICWQELQRTTAAYTVLRVEDDERKLTTNVPLCDDHGAYFSSKNGWISLLSLLDF